KGFARSELQRAKTDKLDAALIARFARALSPKQWHPMNEQQRTIRDIRRYVDDLIAQRVQETNRLKSGRLDSTVQSALERHL
ncbi:transposase, partial [Acinetobacter baumannii]